MAKRRLLLNENQLDITGSSGVRSVSEGTGIDVTGTSVDPIVNLTGQALALHNLNSNGLIARTSLGAVSARSIANGTGISISNGDGVSGNPTISLNASLDNLSDVSISAPSNNQILKFNGTSWINDANPLDITETFAITGETNNLAKSAQTNRIILTGTAGNQNLTGIQNFSTGQHVVIHNATNGIITIKNNSVNSTSTNRFDVGEDIFILPNNSKSFIYYSSRIRMAYQEVYSWSQQILTNTIVLNDSSSNVTYTCNSSIEIYENESLKIKFLYLSITNINSSGTPSGGSFEIKGFNFYQFIGANDLTVLYEVKTFSGTSYSDINVALLSPDALGTGDGQLIFRKRNDSTQQPPFTSSGGTIRIKIAVLSSNNF